MVCLAFFMYVFLFCLVCKTILSNMSITSFDLKLHECPLCKSAEIKHFADWDFKGLSLKYQQCQQCGFIFQNPTYSEKSWAEFYKYDYRKLYNNDDKPGADVLRVQEQRADYYTKWLKSVMGKVKSHLDVGASAGVFLQTVRENFDIQRCVGVEPGDEYRTYAKEHNISMFENIDELIESKPEKFDLVSLCHVFEHIPDMVPFLEKLQKHLLADHGYLFIEVPNIRGGQSFEVAHPNCFSLKTLSDALGLAGFKIMASKEHGMPKTKHPHVKMYLSAIAVRTSDPLTQATQATQDYLKSSKWVIRKGMTTDTWPMFWLKYPIRKLLGKFPV